VEVAQFRGHSGCCDPDDGSAGLNAATVLGYRHDGHGMAGYACLLRESSSLGFGRAGIAEENR
jgi:hypothetical protein